MKWVIAASIFFLTNCGGAPNKEAEIKSPTVDKQGQEFDTNQDGKADSWKFFRKVDGKQALARKEFDINFDGKVDIWRVYDLQG